MKLWVVEKGSIDGWGELGALELIGVFTSNPDIAKLGEEKGYKYTVTEVESDIDLRTISDSPQAVILS